MLIAHDENRNRVWARAVGREAGPFYCPVCDGTVRLHKGNLRVHHFAHVPGSGCMFGVGESEAHRRAKESIHFALMANGITSLIEAPLGDLRPDVLAMMGNELVGIEVQISAISLDEISRRSISYARRGIAVLWVICDELPPDRDFIRFPWRERFLHGMYFGRVYYYTGQDYVVPVHFGSTERKTIKWPVLGPRVKFSDPRVFNSVFRRAWSYSSGESQIEYPQSKLWIDMLPKWWDEIDD